MVPDPCSARNSPSPPIPNFISLNRKPSTDTWRFMGSYKAPLRDL